MDRMEQQAYIHLHELLAEVANETVESQSEVESRTNKDIPVTVLDEAAGEIFDLEDYYEVDANPHNIEAAADKHKAAVQTLASSISEEMEKRKDEDEINGSNADLHSPGLEEREEESRDSEKEWRFGEEDTVKFKPHIHERLDGVDEDTAEIARELLDMDVKVNDGDDTYDGSIIRFDTSLSVFEVAEDGERIIVEDPEIIDFKNSDLMLRTVEIDELDSSPLAVKDHDFETNRQYISEVEERGGLFSLPKVRPVENGYEIFDGHKGAYVALQAGLDNQLVYVEDLDAFEAAEEFVKDHIIAKEELEQRGNVGRTWYSEENAREVVDEVQRLFGERAYEMVRVGDYLESDVTVPDGEEVIDRSRLEKVVRDKLEDEGLEASDRHVEALCDVYYDRLEAELSTLTEHIERDAREALGAGYDEELGTYESIPDEIVMMLEPEEFVSSV